MAKEKYTVIYELESAGALAPANWKEGDFEVTGKLKKHAGTWTGYPESTQASNKSVVCETAAGALKTNKFQQARVVTIEAESGAEAAAAIRAYVGQGAVDGKCLTCVTSNLTESEMQP
jgi:hypothetical protein